MLPRRYLWPLLAGTATLGGFAVLAGASAGSPGGELLVWLWTLAVPILWGLALLGVGPRAAVLTGTAVLALVAGLIDLEAAGAGLPYVACGLLLGWALRRRLAYTWVLSLAALPLLIFTFWLTARQSPGQMLTQAGQDLTTGLERVLPPVADQKEQEQRQRLLAEYEHGAAAVGKLLAWLWPGVIVLGGLAQTGLDLLLLRAVVPRAVDRVALRPLPVFSSWRLPFHVVWLLVAGIGLIVLRQSGAMRAGVNLVLVAAALLSVQGLAVQAHWAARLLSPGMRILFWTLVGLFLAPPLLVISVLLGLVDQWLDLRRLPAFEQH
jgi:hypothetical protein